MNRYSSILRVTALILTAILIGTTSAASAANGNTGQKNILVLNSYNDGAAWNNELTSLILNTSAHSSDFTVNVVNLNFTYITNDTIYERTLNGVINRFPKVPDGMVILGEPGFTFLEKLTAKWGNIPTIFIGNSDRLANEKYYYTGASAEDDGTQDDLVPLSELRDIYDFTFIESPIMYKETIDLMVRMNPELGKIVFAADELSINRHLNNSIRSYIAATYPEIDYEWLVGNAENGGKLLNYLTGGENGTALLFSSWFYTKTNVNGYPSLVTGDYIMVKQARQPIYTLREAYLDKGILGGYYPDYNKLHSVIVRYLKEMVAGTSMSQLPFFYPEYPADFHYVVNYPQMKLCGYTESDCPSDTVYVNKPESAWKELFWYLLVGVLIIALVVILLLIKNIKTSTKLTAYREHYVLVRNMPIAYGHATVHTGTNNKVMAIELKSDNQSFEQITSDPNIFLNMDYVKQLVEAGLENGHSVTFTHYFKDNDTYYNFLITQGAEPGTIEIFGIDNTKQNKAENELRESRKQLQMTLSVARIIPWQWDLETQRICCDSGGVFSHMNFQSYYDEKRGQNIVDSNEIFQRIHKEDLPRIRKAYQNLVDRSVNYIKEEFRVVTLVNGEEQIDWLEVNATVDNVDNNDRPTALTGSLLLITERKKQEQNLIQAKEHARESDRLKSAFLANMSHEIRTPLNAIVGFSNLLATTNEPEKKEKFISIIENNNQLLLQLISDILDLAKVEANTLEFIYQPTDLNELIRNLENTVRLRLKPGVVLNFTLGAAECVIEAERNRLSQVLINMLTNACKFTEKGSITFGYELRGKDIYFFVRDTGIGIDREKQSSVFQRFTKLNDFVQGTGLGLSICQSIIEKMGGTIGVESPGLGLGSTFWFTIPFKEVKNSDIKAAPAITQPKETIKKDKLTLLVAEDNESNYLLFDTILSNDYNLIHAWDGVEAVELFKLHQPNIIIMDINMPNMDGYEATREIRKISKTVPIIAVTAYAFASDKDRIMENGFNGYVSKPVNANKLKSELRSTVDSSFIIL